MNKAIGAAYLLVGGTNWLYKTLVDTKKDYDNMFIRYGQSPGKHQDDIVICPIKNAIYYSPNIILWPINLAIDAYTYSLTNHYNAVKEKELRKREGTN